ncbi:MAG: DUF1353 domain-containing protein, partial [Gammaproteobacteria bacterium]|nr:DUF1353 domain-containing protein [Gammaproteobacteria bacterium]
AGDDNKFRLVFDRHEFPQLEPVLLPTKIQTDGGTEGGKLFWFLKRLWAASERRRFRLVKDWNPKIYNFKEGLNGELTLKPCNQSFMIDGASVPMPWLISMLSLGVLRPLGILLTASIIHDFAFKYGYLVFKVDGKDEWRAIERHDADELFRKIISQVNGMPIAAFFAWVAVRLGYFGVQYAGKRFGRRFPILAVLVLLFVASLIWFAIGEYGLEHVAHVIAGFVALLYTLRYIATPTVRGAISLLFGKK